MVYKQDWSRFVLTLGLALSVSAWSLAQNISLSPPPLGGRPVMSSPMTAAAGTAAAGTGQPVTGQLKLGPQEGAAHPSGCGRTATGGGNITVSQPAPDTIVVRMTGNVAACGNLLKGADAALNFCENLQFCVEFSQPGHTGQLMMETKLVGSMAAKGCHATVGVTQAATTISCESAPVLNLSMPPRSVGGSVGINSVQGPVCAPVCGGIYSLNQVFRIFASDTQGAICGRAIGEFSPSPLAATWLGPSYPFASADKSAYGYQVTLRLVPEPSN